MIGALLLALLPLTACDGPVDCATLGEASLLLGQGERAFTPLNPGDRLERERGSQGGSHVWVALRVDGIWPGRLDLFGDDQAPSFAIGLRRGDVGVGQLFGPDRRVILDRQPPHDVVGLQVRLLGDGEGAADPDTGTLEPLEPNELWARVEDTCGTVVEATMPVEL